MTMAAFLRGKPIMQPYSVGAGSCNAGDVVVVNDLPCVAHEDIPAFTGGETTDSLAVSGGIYQIPADAAYADGTYVLWDTSKLQVTTVSAITTYPFGWIVGGPNDLASDGGPTGAASLASVLHHPVPSAISGKGSPEINTAYTTTAATGTLTAAAIAGGVITRSGPTAAFTDTTDTAAHIIAAIPDAVAGQSFKLQIKNTTAFAETLVGGTNVTLSGGQTIIPPNSVGVFLITYVSATSVTMLGLYVVPMTTDVLEVATGLTTVGAGTITAAGIAGGVTLRTGPTSAFTDTTDTITNIVAALPNGNVGQSWEYTYLNQTQYVATLAGGTDVTITLNSGQLLVPGNSYVRFLVTYVSGTSITMVQIGGGLNATLPTAKFTTFSATTGTLVAGEASGAAFTCLTSTNATPGSQAMRTPAQILADTPGLVVGQSYMLLITNSGGSGTLTLATDSGTGFTMTGTMTVANTATRLFIVTLNSGTTGTVQGVSIGTIA